MKWFMHDSRARNDAKLAKIIIRHGIEGYGLYFACIEIIADELTPSNFNFELEHDSELLAAMFRMDTLKVEKIMRDFVELGLFEYSETTHRVACYKLAKRLDNATSQNKEVQAILKNFKELKVPQIDLKQIRLDENREDKIKEEVEGKTSMLPADLSSLCGMARKAITKTMLSATDIEVIKSWPDVFTQDEIETACQLTRERQGKSVGYIDAILRSERDKAANPKKREENLHHGAAYKPAPDLMAEIKS
jgi:DNA replication protein DnaD